MRRIWLGSILIFLTASPQARSQYLFGGSTPQGDYLRGVGAAAAGLGSYNLNTAQAYSIDVDANIRLDNYIQVVLRAGRDNWNKLDKLAQEKQKANYEAIRARIRDNPQDHDVFTGNALNAAFDQLNDPRIQEASLRSVPVTIPREVIRRIPFKLDTKGLIFSLQRLSVKGKGKWPVAFQPDAYDQERRAYEKVIDKALDQMVEGKMLPETINEYEATVQALSNHLEQEYPVKSDRRYTEARTRLNEMSRVSNLLKTTEAQVVMAELDRYAGRNVNDLRLFMQAHKLRFADVSTADERRLYVDLYASIDQVRGLVVGKQKGAER